VARRALPAAFATITKIIPPAFRRDRSSEPDPRTETKVVFGDYYAALAGAGMLSSSRSRPWPVERAVVEGFERIIWVHKSVETIAGQASRLKFELHQGDDVVDDHPLYRLLNVRANPMETGRQFRSRLGKQILLSKPGSFVEMTKARNGTPLRFDLLPPGRTRPVPGSLMSVQATGQLEFRLIDHYETIRADGTRAFIPAEDVIWFREPHPLDPYSGVTPLESAGMSVELDFFARLYNTTFMKNDARPGGIVGINGDMDDDDMKKLEETFARGPAEAGKLTVVAGEVSYVDSVVRPRDAQHGQTSDRAKIEILDAFGCPESMFGNAGGRTFDNAGQEGYNFWTITMAPFLDLQVTGVDELSEPELEGFFDVSHVPALAAAEAAKREEARAEWAAGLISIDQYLEATGKEPYDLPATRALVIASVATLIPTSAADQKALGGALVTLGQPPPPPPGTDPAAIEPGSTQAAIGASPSHPAPGHRDTGPAAIEASAEPDNHAGQPDNVSRTATAPAAPATKAIPPPRAQPPAPYLAVPVSAPQRLITACQVKSGPRPRQPAPPNSGSSEDEGSDTDAQHDQADQQAERLEAALALVLAALAARWAASALTPDPSLWQAQAQAAVTPLVAMAAAVAAARARAAIGSAGDQAPDPAEAFGEGVPGGPDTGTDVTATVTRMVGAAAAALAVRLAATPGIDIAHEAATWAAGIAVQAATAMVNAAADLAATIAARVTGKPLVRVWRTRRDNRVRETHRLAEGQQQPPGVPFLVGGEPLMYPGDPAGSPDLVYGCRCRVTHKIGTALAG
jgi:HK97 family phage portal protein